MTDLLIISADSETTGNDPRKDEMCQFGSVGLFYHSPTNFHIETLLSTYCKPSIPIQSEAIAIHGITEDDCKWAASPERVLRIFKGMVDQFEANDVDVIMAGHNVAGFDFPIFHRHCPDLNIYDYYMIDTLMLARRHYPDAESHKLGDFYTFLLGREPQDAHDAAADCWMCSELIVGFCEKLDMTPVELAESCATGVVYEFMPYGKHKGLSMNEVPKTYLKWMKRNFKNMDPDTVATVKHYLQ